MYKRQGVPFDENTVLVTPPPCGDPVADAMGRLPPRCREALLLRYGCGYSTRETASLLELSFAAAQKLLQLSLIHIYVRRGRRYRY